MTVRGLTLVKSCLVMVLAARVPGPARWTQQSSEVRICPMAPQAHMILSEIPRRGCSRGGVAQLWRNLCAKFPQNWWRFVSYITRSVDKVVANSKVNFGQVYAENAAFSIIIEVFLLTVCLFTYGGGSCKQKNKAKFRTGGNRK